MSGVIDETWERCTANEERGGCSCNLVWRTPSGPSLSIESYGDDENIPTPEAVKRIVAVAPEALRLLLAAEWGDTYFDSLNDEDLPRCPWCHRLRPADDPEDARVGEGHADDCPLAALLVKAGVR